MIGTVCAAFLVFSMDGTVVGVITINHVRRDEAMEIPRDELDADGTTNEASD